MHLQAPALNSLGSRGNHVNLGCFDESVFHLVLNVLFIRQQLNTFCLLQGEIHELLALVYYDGLQNVVPFYDQRSVVPSKDAVWMMFCHNSMRHFKEAFAHK